MSKNQNPTIGQKLFIFLLLLFVSFSIIYKPIPPQNEPNVLAKQNLVKDFSKEDLPYFQSEIYLKNKNSPNLQTKLNELLNTSNNQDLSVNSESVQILKPKDEIKKDLNFDDEIGIFVNSQNKINLIEKTKNYIAKYSKSDSVLDAEMLVNFAQNKNFPLDLIIVQAQIESNFCTNGRAVISKQCWNIGAFDGGDTKQTNCSDGLTICQNSYLEGLELYHKFMVDCNFQTGEKATIQKFIDRDFRQVREGSKICGGIGKRYATDSNYRTKFITILQNNFNPNFAK